MWDNVLDEDNIDDVLDEELEEVKPNVGEHCLDDDMVGIDDSGDNVDMANPFYKNSELDDRNEELDEEEY